MRLQDLKDIADHVEIWWSDPGLRSVMPGEHACLDALVLLARRVTALYDNCPYYCQSQRHRGFLPVAGESLIQPCPCGGWGFMPTDAARALSRGARAADLTLLARYLFGEDT